MNTMVNKLSMANKLGGIPVCLVAVAIAAEMICGDLDEVPIMEILIVGIAVPIALYLTKKRSTGMDAAKKAAVAAATEKKMAPWRQSSSARQGQEFQTQRSCPASTEKITEKARLDSLVKEGKLTDAQALLTELISNSSADAVSYNMVISACAKSGDVNAAHAWMQRMLDQSVQPDVASLNSVIDSCARSGDVAGAERWLARL